mgnify:CR=1 FL=1
MLPDGSINPGEMTSFNHYALGAVADWLHRTVAGLAPAAPGYRRIEVRPQPGGGLASAAARHRTPYGMAAASWQIAEGRFELAVEVPANTSALVYLPAQEGEPVAVGSGRHRWSVPYQPPVAAHGQLTVDSTLGDLIDQPEVYERVMALIAQHNYEFADRMDGRVGVTLRQAILMNPNAESLLEKVAMALAAD